MTMRLWAIPVLVGLLVAAACGSGFAIPSLDGPSGIVTVPNSSVAPSGSWDMALSYQKMRSLELVQSAGMYGGRPILSERTQDKTAWSIQALTGVGGKTEMWAAYHSIRNESDSHIWGLGAKMQFAGEPERPFALAGGISFQEWADHFAQSLVRTGGFDGAVPATTLVNVKEDLKVWKVYAVASKDFTTKRGEKPRFGLGGGNRLLGHAGLMYIKLDGTVDSNSLTRPFIAAELTGGLTEAGVEYRFSDNSIDQRAVLSAVLRQKFSPDVSAELGVTNADPVGLGLNDREIFVRIGYNIPSHALY